MRKYYSLLAVAALMIAACTNEKEFIPASDGGTILTAVRDASAVRTVIQEDGKTLWWNVGETIDVFYGGGSKAVVFTGQNEAPAATADFKGNLDIPANNDVDIYAIYPSILGSAVSAEGEITVGVCETQPAVAGSFDDGIFPAVAVSKTTTLAFCNVAGGIKFSVGEDGVTEVEFKANGTEALAGIAHLKFVDGVPVIQEVESPVSCVTVLAPQGGFVKGENYYAAVLPAALESGITITLKRGNQEPIVIASDKAQTVKRGIIGNVGILTAPKSTKVARVWGLYSTSAAAWNEYYGGTANTDRNVAMDDEYIYIAETRSDEAKLWAISIANPEVVKAVNVEGVDGGFWKLACPRVINDKDGKGYLLCSNMNSTGETGANPKLYIWENGIDAAPTAKTLNCSTPYERIGDTFSFWGTLDKGMLLMASTTGQVRMWKFENKILSNGTWVNSRYVVTPKVEGVAAWYPFPNDKNHGVYCVRDDVQAYSTAIEDGKDAWTAPGGTLLNVKSLGSNYFKNVACFQYIPYGDRKFIAYTRNVSGEDGRIMITEGKSSEDWSEVIARRHAGELLYQAAIQNSSEIGAINEEGNGRASGNSGMDIAWRVIDGDLYLACVKQNVGLSLFKLTLE